MFLHTNWHIDQLKGLENIGTKHEKRNHVTTD